MNAQRPIRAGGDLQDELAAVIGQTAVTRLMERLGGTRTYVPRKIGVHHPIAEAIGLKAANMLADHYFGMTIDLPKAHLRRRRALETALNRPDGVTIKQIALDFDYSERQIYNMIDAHQRAKRDTESQLDLFDRPTGTTNT